MGRRGEDNVLWGRWYSGGGEEAGERGEWGHEEANSPKNKKAPTSKKRMRELGEPKRKVQKMEKLQEHPNPAANTVGPGGNDRNTKMEEKRERDLPRRRQDRETRGESAAQKRTRKAMRRANLEIKTKERRE